ncbi:MAG: Xylella phage Salvo [Candidatus Parcubacteria bacterium]|jgi:ribA/ribD-fused uncharacterized protein
MTEKILFDEQGLTHGTPYVKGQWEKIATHTEKEIKGFFGPYRFLSNFGKAVVFLDGDEYATVENAYQAAKYKKESRDFLKTCPAKQAIIFTRAHPMDAYSQEEWDGVKLGIMRGLLEQKFDATLNPENHAKLLGTGDEYLEETNYWGDKYWGVSKSDAGEEGVGENNLGKSLMAIRDGFVKKSEGV